MQSEITELSLLIEDCSYDSNDKETLINIIKSILSYPKKIDKAKFSIKELFLDKIIVVWYPIMIPFNNKYYNVPIKIYFKKGLNEAPLILLDLIQDHEINQNNKNINPKTRRITTTSLEVWTDYSSFEYILDEIYESFSNNFPFIRILHETSFSFSLNTIIFFNEKY